MPVGWAVHGRTRGCTAVWLGFALTTCAPGSEPDYLSAEEFCETDCRRWGECSRLSLGDIEYCKYYCLGSGWPQRIRKEVLTAFAGCLDRLSCTMLESSEARDACFSDAFEDAQPSEACVSFCEADTAKAFECGYRFGISDCLRYNCGVVDSVLARAAECPREEDCEEWGSCVQAAFSFD